MEHHSRDSDDYVIPDFARNIEKSHQNWKTVNKFTEPL